METNVGHMLKPIKLSLSMYGQTKHEGKIQALRKNNATKIIRKSWLYSSFGTNFVKTMLRMGREKDSLKFRGMPYA